MGYQESYVYAPDFTRLVELFQKLGEAHFDDRLISPVEIITLKKDIRGNYAFMCRPDEEYYFPARTKFIYVVGERSGQCSTGIMFGSSPQPKGVLIIATECFPSEEIFTDPEWAEHIRFA